MAKYILLTIIVVLVQLLFAQDRAVEKRNTINKYDNGQILREHVKYQDNDTLIEFIYFQNGKLNHKRQILNNQRTGWSYTYNEKGELLFRENYLKDKLTGDFEAFYPSGQTLRKEFYEENRNIDTTTWYNENGQITKKIVYLMPCEFGSKECNQLVFVYENGSMVYSYEIKNGSKSENRTVYDQSVYQSLMVKKDQIPLYEKP